MKALIRQTVRRVALAILLTACCSASAFYNPHVGRWVNRDPIGESGFRQLHLSAVPLAVGEDPALYAFVRNNPISQFDSLGLFCENPCEEARKKNLHMNPVSAGGVICCQGKKYACVWPENIGAAKNPTAISIISSCILKHETEHFAAIVCPVFCQRNEATRPPFWVRVNAKEEECKADKIEYSCLLSGVADCKGDAQCEQEVKNELVLLLKEMQKANCAPPP